MQKYGLGEALKDRAKSGTTPILGICLGMHLICESSEEGTHSLGLIKAVVKKFDFGNGAKLKIPHMVGTA